MRDIGKKSNKSVIDNQKVTEDCLCVLGETHNYAHGQEIMALLGDDIFVDKQLSCLPCEHAVRGKYAIGVNSRQIDYPYEVYRDTYLETGLYNLICYSNITDKHTSKQLEGLQKDLRAFNEEKIYDVKPITEDDKIVSLRKQNYYVEDYRNDKKTSIKFIIHLPVGRLFTITSESAIIRSLSSKPIETNFQRKYFVVYKDEGLAS